MQISIIGAGPGGYETAIYASKLGLSVTLFNGGKLGGTCLNEGCIPTKTFCHYSETSKYEDTLINKQQVVERLQKGVGYLLKQAGIQIVNSKAAIKDSNTVVADGIDYKSDYIIIATGSKPAHLNVPGCDSDYVMDSNDILNLSQQPTNLCIIGGGVIGMEIASYMNSFGVDVSVYEYAETIIPNFDKEISERLSSSMSQKGINIHTSSKVESLEDNCITFTQNGETFYDEIDNVLMSVGRKPCIDGLFDEILGIEVAKNAITVNDNMQTSIPNIYAIGDVNGRLMLAHVATFQGKRAVNHILGIEDSINFDIVPSVVYSNPEVAFVGLTEEQCKADGIDYKVLKSDYIGNGRAVSMAKTDGFIKILVDKGRDTILGGHIIGYNASELIQEIVVMMNCNVTIKQCQSIIHAHPTLCEIIQSTINNLKQNERKSNFYSQ